MGNLQVEVIRRFLFSVIYTHKIITLIEALMGHVYLLALYTTGNVEFLSSMFCAVYLIHVYSSCLICSQCFHCFVQLVFTVCVIVTCFCMCIYKQETVILS